MINWLKKLPFIAFAILALAVALNMFLGPHNIASGGLSGLGIILESAIGVDRSTVILIGNTILVVLAFIILGKETVVNTLFGAYLLPIFTGIVPRDMIIEDTMLSMLIGSAIAGAAVVILYNNSASSGGTTIPPLIFKKLFRLPTSLGLFLTDGVIVALTIFVFGLESFFLAIVSIVVSALTMEYLETGLNKKKFVHIISDKHEEIKKAILTNIERGVTIVPAVGAYTNEPRNILIATLAKKDYQKLLAILREVDPDAFVIASNVADVHGKGFNA